MSLFGDNNKVIRRNFRIHKAYFRCRPGNQEVRIAAGTAHIHKGHTIGFSDDDARNIEKIKDFLDAEDKDKLVKTYLTKGGEKQEV